MKRVMFWLAVTVSLLGGSSARADYIQFNYDSTNLSVVTITGAGSSGLASIDFNNAAFAVTGVVSGSSGNPLLSGAGYNGAINGNFTVDPNSITTTALPGFTLETAPVGGSGTLTLTGNGATVTSTITFNEIYSTTSSGSSTGTLDSGLQVTLSNFQETGTDGGGYLDRLFAINTGQLSATFSFTGADTPDLITLTAPGGESGPNVNQTNFHGQIVAEGSGTQPGPIPTPVPASWLLLATGTTVLGGFRLVRRRGALALA
jgi:hypothetical protein